MFGKRSAAPVTAQTPEPPLDADLAPEFDPSIDLAIEPEPLWQPPVAKARRSVEQLLLERGHINAEQLDQAKTVALQTPGKSIAQILLTMSAASEEQILSALAETLGLTFETPQNTDIDPDSFGLLQPDYMRRRHVVPIRREGRTLVVGMADPTNVFLLDEVRRKTKADVKVVVITTVDVNRICEQMTNDAVNIEVDSIIKDMAEDDVQVVQVVQDDVSDLA